MAELRDTGRGGTTTGRAHVLGRCGGDCDRRRSARVHGPMLGETAHRCQGQRPGDVGPGALEGMPASTGQVSGVARMLLDLAHADRRAPGEILVTTATSPAWTSVFGRSAAIATDGGSLVTHASLSCGTGSRPRSRSAMAPPASVTGNTSRSTATQAWSSSANEADSGPVGPRRLLESSILGGPLRSAAVFGAPVGYPMNQVRTERTTSADMEALRWALAIGIR